jgi:hypothetical protein
MTGRTRRVDAFRLATQFDDGETDKQGERKATCNPVRHGEQVSIAHRDDERSAVWEDRERRVSVLLLRYHGRIWDSIDCAWLNMPRGDGQDASHMSWPERSNQVVCIEHVFPIC